MPHSEALSKIAEAARGWLEHARLAPGQRAMARTLETRARELVGISSVSAADLEKIKLMTCHLATAANAGRKPDPENCTFGLCSLAECAERAL